MVYEDTAERHRFDSFCKVVLRHAMLDCFREFSYQNKWLLSLNYLPQPIADGICTTDQYPSDYITFSADGYTLQISNEQLANIIEKLPQSERRLLILRFVPELNDREIGRRMCCSRSAIQRRRTSALRNMREQLTGKLPSKKSSGKYKPSPLLSVIEVARAVETDAMEQILQHYDAYINKLCLQTMVDENRQAHKQVDPYMKGRLQSKLMHAITKK